MKMNALASSFLYDFTEYNNIFSLHGGWGGGRILQARGQNLALCICCREIQNLLKFSLKENHLEKEKGAKTGIQLSENRLAKNSKSHMFGVFSVFLIVEDESRDIGRRRR
jgi:hypothetical protein